MDESDPPPAALSSLPSPPSSSRSSPGDSDALELVLAADSSIGVSPGGESSPGGGVVTGGAFSRSPRPAASRALLDSSPGLPRSAAREAPTSALGDALADFLIAFTRRRSSSRTSFGWLRSIDPKSSTAGGRLEPSTVPPLLPRLSSPRSLDSSSAASPWTKLALDPLSVPFPAPEPPAPLPPSPVPSPAPPSLPEASRSLVSSAAPSSAGTPLGGSVGARRVEPPGPLQKISQLILGERLGRREAGRPPSLARLINDQASQCRPVHLRQVRLAPVLPSRGRRAAR